MARQTHEEYRRMPREKRIASSERSAAEFLLSRGREFTHEQAAKLAMLTGHDRASAERVATLYMKLKGGGRIRRPVRRQTRPESWKVGKRNVTR